MGDDAPSIRMAEVTIALSLATDLGTGQPMDHALRTCALSLAAAEALGLDDAGALVRVLRGAAAIPGLYVGCVGRRRDRRGRRRRLQRHDGADLDGVGGRGDALLRAPPGRGPADATAGRQDRQGIERSGLGEPQLLGSLRGRGTTRPTTRPGRRRVRCARPRLRALGRQGTSRRSGRRGGAGGGPHRRRGTRRRAVHPPLRLAGRTRRADAPAWPRLRPERRRRPRR